MCDDIHVLYSWSVTNFTTLQVIYLYRLNCVLNANHLPTVFSFPDGTAHESFSVILLHQSFKVIMAHQTFRVIIIHESFRVIMARQACGYGGTFLSTFTQRIVLGK